MGLKSQTLQLDPNTKFLQSLEPCCVIVCCCAWSSVNCGCYYGHCNHYWLRDKKPFPAPLKWWRFMLFKGAILGFCPSLFLSDPVLSLLLFLNAKWHRTLLSLTQAICQSPQRHFRQTHDTLVEFLAYCHTVEHWNNILWLLCSYRFGCVCSKSKRGLWFFFCLFLFYIFFLSLFCLDR